MVLAKAGGRCHVEQNIKLCPPSPILPRCTQHIMNVKFHQILAVVNLVVCSVLVCDTFFFRPVRATEVFGIYRSSETRSIYTSSHWTNFIICASGNTYREPQYTNHNLQSGEKFVVVKSFLFRRPIELQYSQSSGILTIRCGALNENKILLTVPIYVIVVSILLLLKPTFFNNVNLMERLIFSATALLSVMSFFYFTS
jgi:hypothetical protein